MPRTNILPPVSFVSDLSISGNSLIQNLVDPRLQDLSGDRVPSFTEQLRARPAPEPPQRNSLQEDRSSRTDYLETKGRLENRTASSDRSRSESIGSSRSREVLQKSPADRRVDTAQDHRAIPSQSKARATEQVSPGSESQNRSEQAGEVHNADGQKVAPAAQNESHAQQHNEEQPDQQVNVDATPEQSQAVEMPPALLKHLEKFEIKTEQNEVVQVGGQQESATDQPVPLAGLLNALQGQSQPQQDVPGSDVVLELSEQATEEFNVLAEELPGDFVLTDSEEPQANANEMDQVATDQVAEDLNLEPADQTQALTQTPINSVTPTDVPIEEEASERVTDQESSEITEDFVSGQSGSLESEGDQVVAQTDQASEQVSAQNAQAEQNQHGNNPQAQQAQQAQATADQHRSEKSQIARDAGAQQPEQNSEEQQNSASSVASVSGGSGVTGLSETQAESGSSDELTEPVESAKDRKSAKASGNNESRSQSEATAQNVQQPNQPVSQEFLSSNPSEGSSAGGLKDSSLAEKLTAAFGQTPVSGAGDATEGQKSVQVDGLPGVSSPTAQSALDGARASQVRPVLDTTRPDMSQKLASLIQQAGDSGKPLRIRLNPPELGILQIEVGRFQGQIVARIEVDNLTARALVFEQLQMLRDSLQQQGLRVDRVEVELNESLAREFSSDQSEEQRSEDQQQQLAEESGFGADKSDKSDKSENEQGEQRRAAPAQVVGVSEIDVQV